MTSGNNYTWNVVANCGGGETSPAASSSFTAGNSNRELGGDFVDVLLFPNPAQDYLNVEITLADKETLTISIVDVLGRTVQQHITDEAEIALKLSTSEFGNGMYFLLIQSEFGENQIERFIISK